MNQFHSRAAIACHIAAVLAISVAFRSAPVVAQQSTDDLRAGKSFLATQVYSLEDDRNVLKMFDGLRVADVSDGLDQVGLRNKCLVSAEIGPLWKDTQNYTHRVIGVAVTARYVPTNKPDAGPMQPEAFSQWVGQMYNEQTPEPFMELLREGSILVLEDAADSDIGSIGSNNILAWKSRGCVGVVTSARARDTDEIIAEKIPLYFRGPGRGIRPGRNEVESVNRPIVVGGVLVMPGDVVVADGDGVLVVPREHAEAVARFARATLDEDKGARRRMYDQLGMPHDASVE